MTMRPWRFAGRIIGLVIAGCVLAGCSSSPDKPKPAELPPNAALLGVAQSWSTNVGAVSFPLAVSVNGNRVAVASSDGNVAVLDGGNGRDVWRGSVGEPLSAGVGSDGNTVAVVTRANFLVAMRDGKTLWRQRIAAQVFTAPLVAGERVFVLAADRSLHAYDGETGTRLWSLQKPAGEPLVLRQAGVLMAVGDTLVAGVSGRLVGVNPVNGGVRWEAPIATPRGGNDIERLVELVAGVHRVGNTVCARAFQTAVGCVDTSRGGLLWAQPANGFTGLSGDDRFVFGVESDGKMVAWNRSSGDRMWTSDRLRFRGLSAPLALGRSVIVGDQTGLVHLLSVENGSPLNRLSTDGSAIIAAPVLVDNTLIVVTRNGGVFGFRPE